jgi:prepilin-type N-terminal cleavage/methylation domain-containing protein
MLQLRLSRNADAKNGFTLMEVMVAMVVLTIGMMSAALLMGNVYRNTVRSRYVAMAAALANEKLEDLSRFSISDPRGSAAGGSLTTNTPPQSVVWTQAGTTVLVDYYDTVTLDNTTGSVSETRQILYNGAIDFTTQTFTADGLWHWDTTSGYPSTPVSTGPTAGVTYNRRWLIQQDTPVQYSELITVLVTCMDTTIAPPGTPPITFQMSMVRPSLN